MIHSTRALWKVKVPPKFPGPTGHTRAFQRPSKGNSHALIPSSAQGAGWHGTTSPQPRITTATALLPARCPNPVGHIPEMGNYLLISSPADTAWIQAQHIWQPKPDWQQPGEHEGGTQRSPPPSGHQRALAWQSPAPTGRLRGATPAGHRGESSSFCSQRATTGGTEEARRFP